MKTVWFITNPGSGSATEQKCEALLALFEAKGLRLAGRTNFPDDDLPTPAMLDRASADTAVLFAGDGTINAAVCALADWNGAILLLPGGTMNLLAKSLHETIDPAAIVHAARDETHRVALPYVEAGKHRAFVGVIIGPAASWVHAREMIRAGKLKGLGRAIGYAWAKTFGRGLQLDGAPGLSRSAQAVFITPERDGLSLAAVDARDWRSVAQLGWDWLTGEWVAAAAVTEVHATKVRPASSKPVLALFDGEPHELPPGTPITAGMTRQQFIATGAVT